MGLLMCIKLCLLMLVDTVDTSSGTPYSVATKLLFKMFTVFFSSSSSKVKTLMYSEMMLK